MIKLGPFILTTTRERERDRERIRANERERWANHFAHRANQWTALIRETSSLLLSLRRPECDVAYVQLRENDTSLWHVNRCADDSGLKDVHVVHPHEANMGEYQ